MKIIKTIDLSENNVNWDIYSEMSVGNIQYDSGECVVILQDEDCYVFPVTRDKPVDNYLRAVKSVAGSPLVFYHGFLKDNTIFEVVYEEIITKAMNLEVKGFEDTEVEKDFIAIKKLVSRL